MTADEFNLVCHVGDSVKVRMVDDEAVSAATTEEARYSPYWNAAMVMVDGGESAGVFWAFVGDIIIEEPRGEITVAVIVKQWLEKNAERYDGLVDTGVDCCCETGDLAPTCVSMHDVCKPAHKQPCKDCDQEWSEYAGRGWAMVAGSRKGDK
jgi:hypothetical protein